MILTIEVPSEKSAEIEHAIGKLEERAGFRLFKHYPQVNHKGEPTGLPDVPMCTELRDSQTMLPTGKALLHLEIEDAMEQAG